MSEQVESQKPREREHHGVKNIVKKITISMEIKAVY